MQHRITWHGHSNFEIATPGLNIFIDPWFDGNPAAVIASKDVPRADLILVTHDHGDHLGQAGELCSRTGAHLGCIVELAAEFNKKGLPQAKILNAIGFNIGGTVEFKGVRIHMVQAFHSSQIGRPVGYILTLEDGFTIYHAGDTGVFSSMAMFQRLYGMIDLALLPIGGVFTMDAKQAAMACDLLQAAMVVPMHWGTFPVLAQNPEEFKDELKKFAPKTGFIGMNPGKTIILEKK